MYAVDKLFQASAFYNDKKRKKYYTWQKYVIEVLQSIMHIITHEHIICNTWQEANIYIKINIK